MVLNIDDSYRQYTKGPLFHHNYESYIVSHKAWVVLMSQYEVNYWKAKVDQKFILSEAIKFAMEILRLLAIS